MKATLSEPQPWRRVFDIEIPAEEVAGAYEEALGRYRRKVALHGFRRGKVPPQIIKERFGGEIRAEVIEGLVQKSYEDACKDKSVSPISQAKVTNLKADEGSSLTFTIETEVEPEVEIRGYQKLKVRASPNKVRPAEVDKVVQELLESNATFTEVSRPVQKGDFINLEYQRVEIDGGERTDITSPQYPVEVGASSIKGFDKAVIGRAAGEVVAADIQFPKDYPDQEIAGKKGRFEMKVVKVQERHIPPMSAELLTKVGDFADESALRARISADLEERERERAKGEASAKAIETLAKANPFEIPPSRVDRYIDRVWEDVKRRTPEGQTPPAREEIDNRYREVGIRAMKRHRILEYIATHENIRATQAEVDREVERIARRYGQAFDTLKEAFRRDGTTARIREDIVERKTLDYLIGEFDPAQPEQGDAQPQS